ncbi:MAG: mannose-1-phosphate guanylyltransferase [Alphaproteobacteria bacterium HGW-Alphaproteobacteria-5]|nr:MAG: mannose-1-phosphate guanylyltransferase [Alphaproteobacteria bacterium HGW-Alphaproteobacteria-5]
MRALLLAAGRGTRLRPITDTLPKCLVPIGGQPLLGLWLDRLFDGGGIERAIVNTHYRARQVEAFIAASPWRERIDLIHEDELLGTGGTLAHARAHLGGGSVLMAHADNLTDIGIAAFRAAHDARPEGALMTMALFETDAPESCGIVECDEKGLVTAFHEKSANPPGTLANAAVYILEPEIAGMAAELGKKVVDFSTEIIPRLMGRIYTFRIEGYHRDIGSPEALALANREWPQAVGARE